MSAIFFFSTLVLNVTAITELNLVEALRANAGLILVIILSAWALKRFGMIFISQLISRIIERHHDEPEHALKQREETLVQICRGALNVLIWPIAILMIIGTLGVEIVPFIAAIGVIGFALGFGAQSLVKDVLAGIFIILENQYRIGDVVKLDETSGMVENISLRRTVLRDLNGTVHHVPNGAIAIASNLSHKYAGINLDIGVAYDSDLDKVIEVINKTGKALARDKKWSQVIITPPAFLRVDGFLDSAVNLKITGKVKPLEQWAVSGEFRKRLKVAFDKEGIEIPFPQRVIHQQKETKK